MIGRRSPYEPAEEMRGGYQCAERLTSPLSRIQDLTYPMPVLACVEAVEHVIRSRGLIIDAGDEIFDEYRRQLSMKDNPALVTVL